jgi:hypothetical protein
MCTDSRPAGAEPLVTVAAIFRAGLVGFMVGIFGLWLHALLTST